MNFFVKLYCRAVQGVLKLLLPFLPYRDPAMLDRIEDIPAVLKKEGKQKPLLVTGATVYGLGLCDSLLEELKNSGLSYAVYKDVTPNPTTENVEEALGVYKAEGCDCLVAFGGGSPMDAAKGVGARLARPKKELARLGGILKVRKKIPLLIAVPTTAGTGSETTLACVVVDASTRHKYAISDFPLIPSYAVLDENVTMSMLLHVAATTGMDALTHALEAYLGRGGNGSTRRDALDAIKLIFENLVVSCTLKTAAARKNMLVASHKAGRAFSKAYVGYVHALAHALGGKYNTPHGLANAVLLPLVLREYGKAVHKKLKKIAVFCGLCEKTASPAEGAEAVIGAIGKLNAELGIPKTLAGKKEDIEGLAEYAYREATPLYPTPVLWSKKKLEEIYGKVLE